MKAENVEHLEIFRDSNRYAGWPANYGMWSWADEIVLAFTAGYPDPAGGFHARDRGRPLVTMQARSVDGGSSWDVQEAKMPYGIGLSAHEHMNEDVIEGLPSVEFSSPDGVDFTNPDSAILCGRTSLREGAKSWFYWSSNRCRSWDGPFEFPMFGQRGIAARTDVLVEGPRSAIFLLTSTVPSGDEGRVLVARTDDGGSTFEFVSWLNESPAGSDLMPASLRTRDGSILSVIRSHGVERDDRWLQQYRSSDNGRTWTDEGAVVPNTGDGGNPATLKALPDGRLCVIYGVRSAPYRICTRLSDDEGDSWSDEITLRDDGGSHDLGYPRCAVLPNGKLIIAYYWNDAPEGERYIGGSIWDPMQ